MKILSISNAGQQKSQELFRKDIAQKLSVHYRDLRPVFAGRQVATLITRNQCFILNLGNIKLVSDKNHVLIFSLASRVSSHYFIPGLTDAIRSDADSSHRENNFPLFVLDHTLNFKAQHLKQEFTHIEENAEKLLQELEKGLIEKNLQALLLLKKKISKFQIKVKENEAAMIDILEDEEEIQTLASLAGKNNTPNQKEKAKEEVESILESFLEQQEELLHKISEINENIDDTQEITSLRLQSRRNTIIRLDLLGTMITGALAFLTLITGIFGMNLLSHQEKSPIAFYIVVGALSLSFIIFILWMWKYLKRKKIL